MGNDGIQALPVAPPVRPMLAKRVEALPAGDNWLFEPKWDGFRTLVFRNGDDLLLQSRDLKPLNRYFPELVEPLLAQLPQRCVVDGELVIAGADGLQFGALQLRIHPAASRVALLAAATPASFVAWDLLSVDDEDLTGVPFRARRARLERVLGAAQPPLHLTPITGDAERARDWFTRFEGAGLDGVMAKDVAGTYQPGKRAMLKLKHRRTADCVVAGLRWHRGAPEQRVGSLLLGLYDDRQRLHHVGVAGSFSMTRRRELVTELAPYRGVDDSHPWAEWIAAAAGGHGAVPAREAKPAPPPAQSAAAPGHGAMANPEEAQETLEAAAAATGTAAHAARDAARTAAPAVTAATGSETTAAGALTPAAPGREPMPMPEAAGDGLSGLRVPGGKSRWSTGKDLSWVPLRPELVVEVTYDHLEGGRFRHTAQFLRWRPDKAPAECTYEQLEVTPPFELARIFGLAGSR